MTKLDKIGADLERARSRAAEWTRRVKELEERYREEENLVIQDIVHAADITPEQLSQIIASAKRGNVGAYPKSPAVDGNSAGPEDTAEQEETANEY